MSDWRLARVDHNDGTTGWYVVDNSAVGRAWQLPGYSVKVIRDIHRALLGLSDKQYAQVVKLIESEGELYE